MSWADRHIEELNKNNITSFRPKGHSMKGKIDSGQLITVSKNFTSLSIGDIVLCKVKGRHYVHLIKAIRDDQYLIGNNKGNINGWISDNAIYGKVIKIQD